jgi:hypothetical protein
MQKPEKTADLYKPIGMERKFNLNKDVILSEDEDLGVDPEEEENLCQEELDKLESLIESEDEVFE